MTCELTAATERLDLWLSTVEGALRADGDVRVQRPDDEEPDPRYHDVRVAAPGHGLPTTGRYRYQEWCRRDRARWQLDAYAYDYLNLVRGGSLGYRRHPIRRVDPSGGGLYHVKCAAPGTEPRGGHVRGHRMTLLEARDVFTRIDAAGDAMSCAGLYPLVGDLL